VANHESAFLGRRSLVKAYRNYRVIFLLVLLIAFLKLSVAQQNGQTTGNSTSGGKTGGTESSAQQGTSSKINSRVASTQTKQPIFFTGAVLKEDGTPPPFGAVVELDCEGTVTRVATVKLNGQFDFQLGGDNRLSNVIPDASQSNDQYFFDEGLSSTSSSIANFQMATPTSMFSARFMGCQVCARLQGYRSSVLRLSEGPLFNQNELGTIVVYPLERARGATVSVVKLLVPKTAKKSRDKAKKVLQKKKYDEAEALLKAAIEVFPKYGEAWLDLGEVYQRQHRNDEARRAYTKAIEIDGQYLDPQLRLSWLALTEQKWQEAADLVERALALGPAGLPEIYYVSALSNYNLNRLEIAEESARHLLRLDSEHLFPQAFLILANILTRKNDPGGSIVQLQQYLKYAPKAPDTATIRSLLQEKEKFAGTGTKENK
jgi:tetratricopeptide (TPR) repeat protein